MTVPDATVLARMRRPDITTGMYKRVSDGAAPEDRVPRVKPPSERSFAMRLGDHERQRIDYRARLRGDRSFGHLDDRLGSWGLVGASISVRR